MSISLSKARLGYGTLEDVSDHAYPGYELVIEALDEDLRDPASSASLLLNEDPLKGFPWRPTMVTTGSQESRN
jgi:hypothetical protein